MVLEELGILEVCVTVMGGFFPLVLLRAFLWKELSRDAWRKAGTGTIFLCAFVDREKLLRRS